MTEVIVPILSYREKIAPNEQEGREHQTRAALSRCVFPGMKCMRGRMSWAFQSDVPASLHIYVHLCPVHLQRPVDLVPVPA